MTNPASDDVLARLRALVGPAGVLDDPTAIAPHLVEGRARWRGRTPLVLRPSTRDEVAAIVRVCNDERVAVVPQGGNTGLVGGQIPRPEGHDILLSLERLDRIRAIDPIDDTMTVEAGCTLARAQEAAAGVDRLFPLSLASEGSCQIGGNLSTNAGGVHVVRYGNARALVLGLEVVTAEGVVWNGLRALHKDNTGYDLKQLFIGAEGTLGVITAAVLRLFPRPRVTTTLFAAVPSVAAALSLFGRARARAGEALIAFELVPRFGLELCVRHVPGAQDPLATPSPWYVLADITADRAVAESVLADAAGLVTDATVATSAAQASALWKLRESLSDAQKPEGGSLKHDISVPVSHIPAFVDDATAAVAALVPGIRPCTFGHIGDGNLHFNFSQPAGADKAVFLERGPDVMRAVHDCVAAHNGSISAEHGIGVAKRDEIRRYKSPIEIELMGRIKSALDPNGIMNPGKGVV